MRRYKRADIDEDIRICELIYRRKVIGYVESIDIFRKPIKNLYVNYFEIPSFDNYEVRILLLKHKLKTLKNRINKNTQLSFKVDNVNTKIGKTTKIKKIKKIGKNYGMLKLKEELLRRKIISSDKNLESIYFKGKII